MDTVNSPANGSGQPANVRFGIRPDELVPHSWAARMLAGLRQQNPRLFGKLLTEAAMNERQSEQS